MIGRLWMLGVTLAMVLAACTAAATTTPNLTTDTHSHDLPSEAEQIAFLERYVKLYSAVSEAEYHIVYHDNSNGLVPGPSDWDIRAVMRVADTAPWKAGKTEVATADFDWANALLTDALRPTSTPLYYENAAVQLAIFEPEQIIFLRATTAP